MRSQLPLPSFAAWRVGSLCSSLLWLPCALDCCIGFRIPVRPPYVRTVSTRRYPESANTYVTFECLRPFISAVYHVTCALQQAVYRVSEGVQTIIADEWLQAGVIIREIQHVATRLSLVFLINNVGLPQHATKHHHSSSLQPLSRSMIRTSLPPRSRC